MDAPKSPNLVERKMTRKAALDFAVQERNHSAWMAAAITALKNHLEVKIPIALTKSQVVQFKSEMAKLENQDNELGRLTELAQDWEIVINREAVSKHTLEIFCEKEKIKLI